MIRGGATFNLHLCPSHSKIQLLLKSIHSNWRDGRPWFRFAERQGISIGKRYSELTGTQKKLLWQGDPADKTFPGILACFEELKKWKYKLHITLTH